MPGLGLVRTIPQVSSHKFSHQSTNMQTRSGEYKPKPNVVSPKKFERTCKWKAKRGPLTIPQVAKAPPRLHAIGHKDGTFVFIAEKTGQTNKPEQLYSVPIETMVTQGTHGFRDATGIHLLCTRRGPDGQSMPKAELSPYPWGVFVSVSDNGPDWVDQELRVMQDKLIKEWNNYGADRKLFAYPSRINKGEISFDRNKTLDQTLVDSDIIDIMKLSYGIDSSDDLRELAEDDNIITEFFSSLEEGREIVLKHAKSSATSLINFP